MRAVQRPDLVFDRPDLAEARFDTHPMLGIPVPASGSTAVVFRATVGGTTRALRFFTREDAATQQRYTALNAWFTERGLTGDVAGCRWVDEAILVNGRRWPMVQMEWVDGHTLDRHVEDLAEAEDRAALEALAGSWRALLRRTQAARFAHGDLQHGNVLVDTAGRLRLVDFDSSWIAPFTGSPPPSEVGHRNYQPANRLWGPWMDTFPGLVIYLSLLVLAREPRQWEQFNDGENLLFRHPDFLPPHRTRAWSWVEGLRDPRIDQLAARLRACCAPGWTASGNLEGLLTGPVPWWTRTAAHAAAAAPPEPVTPPSGPVTAPSEPVTAPSRPSPSPPGPTTQPTTTQPTAQPQGRPTWWQQPPSAQTGTAQTGAAQTGAAQAPGQPAAAQPGAARPAPARPAPARGAGAGRVLRVLARSLAAVVAATAAWAVGLVLIANALGSLTGTSGSDETAIAVLLAFVLALAVLVLVLRGPRWRRRGRWRRRRRPPSGKAR
jgi:hypothetical protein